MHMQRICFQAATILPKKPVTYYLKKPITSYLMLMLHPIPLHHLPKRQ